MVSRFWSALLGAVAFWGVDGTGSCNDPGHDASCQAPRRSSMHDEDDSAGLLQMEVTSRRRAVPIVEKRVPRMLWQTWHDLDLPEKYAQNSEQLRSANPTFNYRLVTDADGATFMDMYFPGNISAAYRALLKTGLGAARADLLRYALLYTFGGVYVDLDALCVDLESFILPSDSALLSHEDWWADRWIQWVLVAEPRHPVMKRALEIAVERLHSGFPASITSMHEAVVWTTGPLAFSEAVKDFDLMFFGNIVEEAWHDQFGMRAMGERLQLKACDDSTCAWKRIGKFALVSYRPMCKEFAVVYSDPQKYDKYAMPIDRKLANFS